MARGFDRVKVACQLDNLSDILMKLFFICYRQRADMLLDAIKHMFGLRLAQNRGALLGILLEAVRLRAWQF